MYITTSYNWSRTCMHSTKNFKLTIFLYLCMLICGMKGESLGQAPSLFGQC